MRHDFLHLASFRSGLLAALVAMAIVPVALARVGPLPLAELVMRSEIIVFAKVEAIEKAKAGKRYAKARVTEIWKGAPGETVEFLSSPTWTCDIAGAEIGETVVLFLIKSKETRSFQIAHSGRGRMPLRTITGGQFATICADVLLPKGVTTIEGPNSKSEFMRSIELNTLRELVKKEAEKKKQ